MNNTPDVMAHLAAANPVPEPATCADQARAHGLHRFIIGQPRTHVVPSRRSRNSRRRMAVAAASVAALGAVAVVTTGWLGGQRPAYAATPPMLEFHPDGANASGILLDLAQRAEGTAAARGGPFYYTQERSIGLDVAVSTGHTTSTLASWLDEMWLAADGSARRVQTPGEVVIAHPGDPAVTFHDSRQTQETRNGPGKAGVDLSQLSTDPAMLANQLASDRLVTQMQANLNEPPALRRIAVVIAIAEQQYVPPALWAAMLRVLATTPDLVSQGTVQDRLSRQAIAVSADSAVNRPTRTVLLFDPATGAFRGDERIFTTKYGDGPYDKYLNVKIPCVVESNTLVETGFVDTETARP